MSMCDCYVVQTNVYVLGNCFMKFTRLLNLTLPIIDPSLYIHRFASRLEFGDKTHLVKPMHVYTLLCPPSLTPTRPHHYECCFRPLPRWLLAASKCGA